MFAVRLSSPEMLAFQPNTLQQLHPHYNGILWYALATVSFFETHDFFCLTNSRMFVDGICMHRATSVAENIFRFSRAAANDQKSLEQLNALH